MSLRVTPVFLALITCFLAACDSGESTGPPPDTVTGQWIAEVDVRSDTSYIQTGGPNAGSQIRDQQTSTQTITLTLLDTEGTVTGDVELEAMGEVIRTITESGGAVSVDTVEIDRTIVARVEGIYAPPVLRLDRDTGDDTAVRYVDDELEVAGATMTKEVDIVSFYGRITSEYDDYALALRKR